MILSLRVVLGFCFYVYHLNKSDSMKLLRNKVYWYISCLWLGFIDYLTIVVVTLYEGLDNVCV